MTEISKNILLISGSGRKVGKTTFIRKVIKQNANRQPIAVKITPHFHEPTPGLKSIYATEDFRIFEETDSNSEKDSSLFLQAGAEKVFYIQTTDDFLEQAFPKIEPFFAPGQPVIVESAALRKIVVPGLYLFIRKENAEMKPSAAEMLNFADQIILSNNNHFDINPECIIFNQSWKIQNAQ